MFKKIVIFLVFGPIFLFSQDVEKIVREAYEKSNGISQYSEMTLKIVRPKWEKTYEFKICTLGTDYSLVLIVNPAKERGQIFLKIKDQLWLWNPILSKPIKMGESILSEGWMNSDLSNNELLNEGSIITDYDKKLVNTEIFQNFDCYVIELTPKPNKNIVWGKQVLWITKNDFILLKIDFYDEDMNIVKTYIASDIKTIGGRNIPTHFEVIPLNVKNQKTILEIKRIVFNVKVDEKFFSIQNMQKGMDIVFPVK